MYEATTSYLTLGGSLAVVTDVNSITIPEGGDATIQVKLSNSIRRNMTVSVGLVEGAGVFALSTEKLVFTRKDWYKTKEVMVSSASDGDTVNNQGIVSFSGKGLEASTVTVTQEDNTQPQQSTRVVIDPVTRIEGHLKIETQVENGKVEGAWSTATLFRGIETIMDNRDPRDAPLITQRLCGVCTYIHMLTSSRCLEDAFGASVPHNALIMRNLLLGAQYVHDHIVHFYHLHGLDWVDIVSALEADPDATRDLAGLVSPSAPEFDFKAVQDRLAGFVASGQLGPFKNAYWGHDAYKLPAEANLMVAAHYLEALRKQAEIARLHAIFGGKNPHPHSVIPGGVTCAGELGKQSRIDEFRAIMKTAKDFVDKIYIPDVVALAKFYPEWAGIGGFDNLMSFGEFPLGPVEPDDFFLPQGVITGRDLSNVQPVDLERIDEHVARSWYQGSQQRHPYDGETVPEFSGHDLDDCYSWLKAPRYDGLPMEVGPLARVMVAYASGHRETADIVEPLLETLDLDPSQMFSTLGRTAARAVETQVICNAMFGWLEELEDNINNGDDQVYQRYERSSAAQGRGINEAPRGALGHWMKVQNGNIAKYQMVIPSTWNFGPRDIDGVPGPVETALVGVPTSDPSMPLEMLRVIHSFDPCIACGVHVIDGEGDQVYEVKVR